MSVHFLDLTLKLRRGFGQEKRRESFLKPFQSEVWHATHASTYCKRRANDHTRIYFVSVSFDFILHKVITLFYNMVLTHLYEKCCPLPPRYGFPPGFLIFLRFPRIRSAFVLKVLLYLVGIGHIYRKTVISHGTHNLLEAPLAVSSILIPNDWINSDFCRSLTSYESMHLIHWAILNVTKFYSFCRISCVYNAEQWFFLIRTSTILSPYVFRRHLR